MRTYKVNQQPKAPEGVEVKKVPVPEPEPLTEKQLRQKQFYNEHLNTTVHYERRFVRKIMAGVKPTMEEEDVILARKMASQYTIKFLAQEFGVSYSVMKNAVKGITFQHLNIDFPPQL